MAPFPKTAVEDYVHHIPSSFMSISNILMVLVSAIIMATIYIIFTDMRAKRRESARSFPFEDRHKLSFAEKNDHDRL